MDTELRLDRRNGRCRRSCGFALGRRRFSVNSIDGAVPQRTGAGCFENHFTIKSAGSSGRVLGALDSYRLLCPHSHTYQRLCDRSEHPTPTCVRTNRQRRRSVPWRWPGLHNTNRGLIVFALAWIGARGTAKLLAGQRFAKACRTKPLDMNSGNLLPRLN